MSNIDYFFLVLGMGAVTFIPRWLPLFFLADKKLPEWFITWLELIPIAILSALLAPEIFTGGDPRYFRFWHPSFFAAIPTFIFALKTRSLGGTAVFGMFCYWGAGKLF